MKQVHCYDDCQQLCQLSTNGYCPKPRRMPAVQIAAEIRKYFTMSPDDLSEIVMALAGVVSRTPLFGGSEISAQIDKLSDDIETASDGEMVEATEWEHSKGHKE